MDEQPASPQLNPLAPQYNRSRYPRVIIVLVILCILALGVGAYYLSVHKKGTNEKAIIQEEVLNRNVSIKKLDTLDFSGNKSIGAVTFSSNGYHFSYFTYTVDDTSVLGFKNEKFIVDGKESGCLSWTLFQFSPDGEHIVCGVRKNNKTAVLLDGNQMAEGEGTITAIFSPDSKRLALLMREGKNSYVMVDGVKGKTYDYVSNFVFSPDSKRIAYRASKDRKTMVVLDGQESEAYDSTVDRLTFSPDSKQFAYVVGNYRNVFIVLNGTPLGKDKKYQTVSAPVFSPDSKQFAYTAQIVTTKLISSTFQNFLVVNGIAQETPYKELYDHLYTPVFSPDGTKVAYRLQKGNRELVVVNGIEGKDYDRYPKIKTPFLRV